MVFETNESTGAPGDDSHKVAVVLVALRHFQAAIEAGEDLSHLGGIVDIAALDHRAIDSLCEEINMARPEENYRAVAMSTGHLSEADRDALAQAVLDGEQMVLQRRTGFFLKLMEDDDEDAEVASGNYSHGDSETIKDIIRWAYRRGYRMIEFDCDAQVMPQFPVFDW